MQQTIRLFLLLESACFIAAGVIHSGAFVTIDIHHQAAIAESVIGVVLLIGFGLTWVWPARTRLIGLMAQGFAALGTLVGVFTIAVGVGPRSVPDITFHIAILIVLAWGLFIAARPSDATRSVRA